MNKIERAIFDTKNHIKKLEYEKMILSAELDAYKNQLNNLERIESDKIIPNEECVEFEKQPIQ
jgi:hypothetical protein